jgi:hypothetical protein
MQLTGRRKIAIWTLLILASVLCVVATLTTWVNRQMLDNAAWSRATEQVVNDPQVQATLSTYLVNTLYDNVDVAGAFEERLPPDLAQLAPPIAGALRDPLTQGVQVLFARPRTQQLLINSSAAAHEKLVNVLEDSTGHGISTGDGVVTLDLHVLLKEVATSLGLSGKRLEKLPPDAGQITLMKSDQLSAAQAGVRAVHALSVWLMAAVFAMYGLAIWLARGARRPVLRNVGWALVLVGLLVLVARRLLGNYIVDALSSPEYDGTAHRLWIIGTAILGQIAGAAILYGLVAMLGAVLAGPTRAATAVRSRIAPVLNERQGIAWGAAGGAFLLLVLWGGTHALRTWWGILVLGALLALGVEALRRQTLVEFPAAAVEPEHVPVRTPEVTPTAGQGALR